MQLAAPVPAPNPNRRRDLHLYKGEASAAHSGKVPAVLQLKFLFQASALAYEQFHEEITLHY
jgi:hypothetical protein